MKLWAFIKVTLKGIIKEFPITIFCFAIFPIVLSFLYGYFQRELFNPSNYMDKITVSVKDHDRSVASKRLQDILKSRGVAEFIEIKQDKAEIEVDIPKGYEEGMVENLKATVVVAHKDESTISKANMVSAVIERFNEKLQEQANIQKKIYASSKLDKEAIFKEVGLAEANIYSTTAINNIIIPKSNSLTSYEYYSASIFSFMFVLIILSLVAGYYKEKETGVFNRIISATLSKRDYFNYSLVSYFIYVLIINIVYVAAFRIMGLSFNGAIGPLVVIIIAKSLLEATAAGLVIAFFKNKMVATMVLNAFIIAAATIGGTFAPVDKLGGSILVTISKFLPNTLIINTFKNYLLYNNFEAIKTQLLVFVAVSAAMYLIGVAKVSIKWEA